MTGLKPKLVSVLQIAFSLLPLALLGKQGLIAIITSFRHCLDPNHCLNPTNRCLHCFCVIVRVGHLSSAPLVNHRAPPKHGAVVVPSPITNIATIVVSEQQTMAMKKDDAAAAAATAAEGGIPTVVTVPSSGSSSSEAQETLMEDLSLASRTPPRKRNSGLASPPRKRSNSSLTSPPREYNCSLSLRDWLCYVVVLKQKPGILRTSQNEDNLLRSVGKYQFVDINEQDQHSVPLVGKDNKDKVVLPDHSIVAPLLLYKAAVAVSHLLEQSPNRDTGSRDFERDIFKLIAKEFVINSNQQRDNLDVDLAVELFDNKRTASAEPAARQVLQSLSKLSRDMIQKVEKGGVSIREAAGQVVEQCLDKQILKIKNKLSALQNVLKSQQDTQTKHGFRIFNLEERVAEVALEQKDQGIALRRIQGEQDSQAIKTDNMATRLTALEQKLMAETDGSGTAGATGVANGSGTAGATGVANGSGTAGATGVATDEEIESQNMESMDDKPTAILPQYWTYHWSKSENRWFFAYNPKMGEPWSGWHWWERPKDS